MIAALLATALALAPPAGDRPAASPGDTLTLQDAIGEALRHSPDLRPAEDAVAVARIRGAVAESRYGVKVAPSFQDGTQQFGLASRTMAIGVSKRLPFGTQLSATADSTRYGNSTDAFKDGGYAFGLSQPLLRGFGPAASADRVDARRGTTTSERGLTIARQQLVLTVADAYFSAVRGQRLLDASERTRVHAEALRTVSEARASVGLATQLDVLRADLLASAAEAGLAIQREAQETAEDRLKLLLGRPPDAPLTLTEADLEDPFHTEELANERVDVLVAHALDARVEIREARDGVADSRRRSEVARWNLLPELDLNIGYARRGLGSPLGALLNDALGGWRVGLGTSYQLDRTADMAASAVAHISVRAAEQSALDAERRVAAEVRAAHRAFLRTAQSIAMQTKALDLAEQQLQLAEMRYERGLSGNFDVVDAENSALQARAALIAAEVGRSLAGLALERAVGVLDPERFIQ